MQLLKVHWFVVVEFISCNQAEKIWANDYVKSAGSRVERSRAVFCTCVSINRIYIRVGTVGGLQPVGTATAPNRLENFTTLNRYDDILTVVERM